MKPKIISPYRKPASIRAQQFRPTPSSGERTRLACRIRRLAEYIPNPILHPLISLRQKLDSTHAEKSCLTPSSGERTRLACRIRRLAEYTSTLTPLKFLLALLFLTTIFSTRAADVPLYLDPDQPTDARVADLISRLTLEEKAILLNHRGPTIERLHIRSDQWNQCLNGVQWDRPTTLFPCCLAMSATWNTNLVQQIADALSDEARAIYNGWHLDPHAPGQHKGLIYRAPVINIERNPYWGRNHESWGEDPYLTGRMAVAYVDGLQGNDPHYLKIAATLKHFAVNNVETDRQKLSATVPENILHDYWLPHFHDAIVEAHASSIMASYNAINGTPNNINHWLLTDTLKNSWGFQGFVVSDLGGVRSMVEGHEKKQMDYTDAVAQSLLAGCDFSDREFQDHIPAAVRSGKLPLSRLDDALTRVLRIRFRLGEFDPFTSVPYSRISADVIDSPAHRARALAAAQQSIVLHQNNHHLLPLDQSKLKTIAILGPLADRIVLNNYNGQPPATTTPLQGLRERAGKEVQVLYTTGAYISDEDLRRQQKNNSFDPAAELTHAAELARQSDLAILFVGTDATVEQEGRDRRTLRLTGNQQQLIEKVRAANPRTIIVECSAGPLALTQIAPRIPAILQAWWTGEETGHAIAAILFGDANPAARLPATVYAGDYQVPTADDYDITHGYTYMYLRQKPLFPFGHGLSYTTFKYSHLTLDTHHITTNGQVNITAQITNTGDRPGDEIPQLYIHQNHRPQPQPSNSQSQSETSQPIKQLRGFERLTLAPHQTQTITFQLPAAKLAHWDDHTHTFNVDPGDYTIHLGASSADIRLRTTLHVTE